MLGYCVVQNFILSGCNVVTAYVGILPRNPSSLADFMYIGNVYT